MRAALHTSWTIAKKDLRCEFRTLSGVVTMVLLGFLVVLVFSFSLEPGTRDSSLARSGVLWAAFLFPGLIAVEGEKEVQCLEGLLLCPVSRTAIYLGKLLASLILAFGSGFVVLVFFTVLYDVGLNLQWLALLGVMLLATVGLAAVGTLFAAITTGVRARGALLTILVLPLLVPILVAAARCSIVLLGQEPWEGLGLWPVLMVLYDVIFLAVGILTFDFVVE
jgi:heme exporter protein B